MNVTHRVYHLAHHFAPFDGHVARLVRKGVRVLGMLGIRLHVRMQLLHAGGSFFQRGCGLFGAG